MASTVASRKAKGRRLQVEIRDALREITGLGEGDVDSTPMGVAGEDVKISPRGRELLPISVECKNSEKINVWAAFKQCKKNCKGFAPLLFFSRNHHPTLCVVEKEWVIAQLKRNIEDDK